MRILAANVHQLQGFAPHTVNAYLVAGVLFDAGTPLARRRILRQLRGHEVRAHVVTHGHPDHFGSSHAVCEALDLPLWTGERDAAAVETATPVPAPGRLPGLLTVDPERNRESMRRLAALRPALVLFGHGPPLRDPDRLTRAAR